MVKRVKRLNERYGNRRRGKRLRESAERNPFMSSKYANLIDPEYMDILGRFWTKLSALTAKINKNIDIMHYQDAKLYDVFYNFDDVDEFWLQDQWEMFEDFVREHGCELKSVRHSNSKFYVRNSFLSSLADHAGNNPDEVGEGQVMYAVYDTVLGNYVELFDDAKELDDYIDWHLEKFYEAGEPTADDIKEILNEVIDDYEYLANDGNYVFKNMNEYVDDAIAVIDYIKSFKDNQVGYYQDFVDDHNFDDDEEF